MLIPRSLLLFAACFSVGRAALAQWVAHEPAPLPSPLVYADGSGIYDRGRFLSLGPSSVILADPSARTFYGTTMDGSGAQVVARWMASGVETTGLSTTDFYTDPVQYASDSVAYLQIQNDTRTSAFAWTTTGAAPVDLTPMLSTGSTVRAFQGDRAVGTTYSTNEFNVYASQAYAWNGTSGQNLHEGNGFASSVSTDAVAIDGIRVVGNLYDSDSSRRNALLWNDGSLTNLHTTSGMDALGFASSEARWIVDDYVFGFGIDETAQTVTSFVWRDGQAQTAEAFFGISGASIQSVDAFGTVSLSDASGDGYNLGYQPRLGQTVTPGYAGPYYGEGFGGTRTLVYENNFEAGTNGFDTASRSTEQIAQPANGDPGTTRTLGRFSNEAVSLTLDNLVAGESYSVTGSLLLGGTWDGDAPGIGPDIFTVRADGQPIFAESYYFQQRDEYSAVVGFGPDLSDGFPGTFNTANLRPALLFTATSSMATLTFQAPNSEPVDNEWWSLDNVQVTGKRGTGRDVPEPGTLALVLVAGIGVIFCRRR